jgi:hypothetical protein
MRVDFILAVLALAVASWQSTRSLRAPTLYLTFVPSIIIVISALNFIDLKQIYEIYNAASEEISSKASSPGWDLRTKLLVISVVFSPIGWLILIAGGPIFLRLMLLRDPFVVAAWLIALLPLSLPLLNLLSVKYMLPMFVFAPVFLLQCFLSIKRFLPVSIRILYVPAFTISTILIVIFSVSVDNARPFVQIGTLASRQIKTHDGTRSHGGYLWQMASVDMCSVPSRRELMARQLLEGILIPHGPDILIVGDQGFFRPGAVGWRHLQLLLEQSGSRGVVLGPGRIRFNVNGRLITLATAIDHDLSNFGSSGDVQIVDLRDENYVIRPTLGDYESRTGLNRIICW